jgi:hypothetical protein
MSDENKTTETAYPSGNPWPLLDRLRSWLPGASVAPHPSNMRADAMDALAEIQRLRAVIRVSALRWAPHLTHAEIDEVINDKQP